MAIWHRSCRELRTDGASCAAAVVDNHLLSQAAGQLLGN
jgi:hypothetical protein